MPTQPSPSDRPSPATRYGLAIGWAIVPIACGPAFGAALDPTDEPFRSVVSLGLWALWLLALIAALVQRPATLTFVRVVMPASVAAGVWALLAGPTPGWRDVVCCAWAAAVAVASLSATAGAGFIDGSSYGTERRFGLRPPGALLLGPIEVAWATVVAGATAGPLLLVSKLWLAGALATAIGWPAAFVAARALHALALRCVVFVPAGLVVVDQATLADPVSVPRQLTARVGMAIEGTAALDIGAGALGMGVEVSLTRPQTVALSGGRRGRAPKEVETDAVLLSPSRPGRVLAEAASRGFPVGDL